MKKLIVIFLILALILGILYFIPISFPPLNSVLIYALEKRLDAQMHCGSLRLKLFNSLNAEDIKATGRDGVTLLIKKGTFSYSPVTLFATGRLDVKCSLEDVIVHGKASILDLLADLLSIKYLEDLDFHNIKGSFFIGKEDTIVQGLTGISDYVIFHVDGVTRKDNSINLRLRLLLNEELYASIPNEIRNTLLKKEEGPWMSILIGITGNYKRPSLRLLSEYFRIDIRAK